jgi:la-related protein 4
MHGFFFHNFLFINWVMCVSIGFVISEGEALEEEIRRQVEYFLSREYLSTDPYLVSQMNSDMYFPITTVATLTTFKVDLEVLVKTLRKSTSLSVNDNGTMVKPNFKIQRNTLILRDIPSSTKVEVRLPPPR